eukprot:68880-Rhodomonas_salina.3
MPIVSVPERVSCYSHRSTSHRISVLARVQCYGYASTCMRIKLQPSQYLAINAKSQCQYLI